MRRSAALRVLVLTCFAALPAAAGARAQTAAALTWRLDNLQQIGGHSVSVVGTPRVVPTDRGAALEFNGTTDGIFLDTNPLTGLAQFTLEVVFAPAADGAEEQRFLHIEESGSGNRVLIELRMREARWALDTYLRSGDNGVTLLDRAKTHATAVWHVATLTYDGSTMRHYVDGVQELSGPIAFAPLRDGRTSIGVRQNRVSWFKGCIHSVRIVPRAEAPAIALWQAAQR